MGTLRKLWIISATCTIYMWQLVPTGPITNTIMTTTANASLVGYNLSWSLLCEEHRIDRPTAYSLEDNYPGLRTHLIEDDVNGCPKCVSLGPDGNYFMRSDWGNAWNLPPNVKNSIGIDDSSRSTVEDLWLGIDASYVAQRANGKLTWNLNGQYGSLDQTLQYNTKRIKAVGLNQEDARSYIIIWEDRTFQFNPGKCPLTMNDVKEWVNQIS